MVDRLWRWALHLVRWGLVAMLVGGLIADLERLDGKGWLVRTLTFPLCIAVAPLLSRWSQRGIAYYTAADACIVAPFFLDIGGNMLGLYESVQIFDDMLHLANWLLIAVAFTTIAAVTADGQALAPSATTPWSPANTATAGEAGTGGGQRPVTPARWTARSSRVVRVPREVRPLSPSGPGPPSSRGRRAAARTSGKAKQAPVIAE